MLSKVKVLLWILVLNSVAAASDVDVVFNGFSGANLSLNGLAEITSDGLLKLTNDTKEALGRAFYPVPLSSNGNPLSFSTAFVFAIVPEYPNVSSDGIALALSPSKELSGAMPGQYLGLFNSTNNGRSMNHIVAIELDTVQNSEFADINDNHVGIDVNNLTSVNASPVGYVDEQSHGFKSLKLISGDPMQVWIEYDGKTMQLDVTLAPTYVSSKPNVSLVSYKVNLSSVVMEDMYVGFSASTGPSPGSQYILGWSFSLNKKARVLDLSKLPSVPNQSTTGFGRKSHALAIALPLAAVALLIISIAGFVLVIMRRNKKYAELLEEWEVEYGPHRFCYKDLFKATKGFKKEQLLGVGGFGQVYRGLLPSSRVEVAVKRISHDSRQGMREFIAEIVSLGRLKHRNLVELLGYCRRQGELLLVYNFMPNGSLDKVLFEEKETTLDWNQRFRIIKGVASGLLYLHEGWEQVVIHRDVKAGNVLLDGELNGKLGDFGLARLYEHGTNPQTTHIVGTLGYLAPELSKTGKATTKTDVFAFGAFLLEVACGRRPMEVRGPADEVALVDWVLECWKRGLILEAKDPKLGSDYVETEMELVLKLGLFCSHPNHMVRPSMKQVMQFLEGDAILPAMTSDGLSDSISAQRYDESFDDFIISYPTDGTCLSGSSPLVFSGR